MHFKKLNSGSSFNIYIHCDNPRATQIIIMVVKIRPNNFIILITVRSQIKSVKQLTITIEVSITVINCKVYLES